MAVASLENVDILAEANRRYSDYANIDLSHYCSPVS